LALFETNTFSSVELAVLVHFRSFTGGGESNAQARKEWNMPPPKQLYKKTSLGRAEMQIDCAVMREAFHGQRTTLRISKCCRVKLGRR